MAKSKESLLAREKALLKQSEQWLADGEREIEEIFHNLMSDLRSIIANIYMQYSVDGTLNARVLRKNKAYKVFLQDIEQRVLEQRLPLANTMKAVIGKTYSQNYSEIISASIEYSEVYTHAPALSGGKREQEDKLIDGMALGLLASIAAMVKKTIRNNLKGDVLMTSMATGTQKIVNKGLGWTIQAFAAEHHRAQEAAKFRGATDLDVILASLGVQVQKTWNTMGDNLVRDSHAAIRYMTIPLEEYFILGSGIKTLSPGNSGVAKEDRNCRCWLSYTVGKIS